MNVQNTYKNTKARSSLSVTLSLPSVNAQELESADRELIAASVGEYLRLRLGEYSRGNEGSDPAEINGKTFSVSEFLSAIGRDGVDRVPQEAKDLAAVLSADPTFKGKDDAELLELAVAMVRRKNEIATARRKKEKEEES